jgi:hypothetical protein
LPGRASPEEDAGKKMIVGTDLRSWLDDKAVRQRTRADVDRFAADWNEGARHRAFAAAMAGLPSRDEGAVADAIGAFFEDEGWVGDLIESLAAAMRDDPFFEPPFRHIHSEVHRGLVLFEDDLVSVAVGVTDIPRLAARKAAGGGRGSILFSGQTEIFRFLKAGAARLAFWSAPPIASDFSAATAGKCERTGVRAIVDGEMLRVDGRRESFVVEHAQASLLLLQASVKPDGAPVSVEYDSATCEYLGCSAADDSASRIQMITTLLRKLGCAAAFPAIAAFLDHPSFFVRWHVMRELLGLDAAAALPHLKRMAARDPHPEARRAARTVLDRLESSPGEKREAA